MSHISLNLYDILQKVLNESVDGSTVSKAINDKNYVEITYVDEDSNAPGKRLIQPYVYGQGGNGNNLLRAFQVEGDSLRGRPKWKTFMLDRITSWKPRRQKFTVPPQMQGYAVQPYREDGDDMIPIVYTQAKFGLDNTLDIEREKTKGIKNAPKISRKNTSGPINAYQQRKRNIYTSQPNSKKYDMYRKNVDDTTSEFDRFNDDIWAKAEDEKRIQDELKMQSYAKKPNKNISGPLDTGDEQNDEE